MTETIAALTVIMSLAAKTALGHQIWLNRKRCSVTGISMPFFIIGMLSYDMWVLQGAVGHDMALIWGQAPGAVLCLVIVVQAFLYKRKGFKDD